MSQKPTLGAVVAPDHPAPPQVAAGGHNAQSVPTPPRTAPEAPPPTSATPPQVATDVPPPASATPPQEAPDVPPPATATAPQAAPQVPPPEAATPPKAVAGLSRAEPPSPPPKVVESRRPLEGQPVQSISANAQRVPVSEPVKEYLVAVKTYEQQVGPNIVRGKMFVESLPTTPMAMPDERRFSPLPGTRCDPDMDMGHGRDYMYVPMSSDQGHPMGGGAPPNVERSREDFRNLALGHDIDLSKMAEMGPEVRRVLDMGRRLDQVLDVANMPNVSRGRSGCAQPSGPIMAESYGRLPPTGYVASMGRYRLEACPRDPSLYGKHEPRVGGRPSYEGPNCARRPCSRERTAYVGENRHTRRSMSRASDLSDRIRQDTHENRAENMLEKIPADAASTDDGEPDVRVRPQRHSMPQDSRPPSRNVRQDIDEHRAENMLDKIRAVLASTDDGEPDVRVRPKRHSMPHDSRPPSRNVRQDIDEHGAENMLEKVRADAESLDDGEPDVRIRPRRNSMPHCSRPPNQNVRRASYDDDGSSDRQENSRPWQQRSQRVKNSSLSSSSSSSSVDRPRSGRSKHSKQFRIRKFEGHELPHEPILLIVGTIMMIMLLMVVLRP